MQSAALRARPAARSSSPAAACRPRRAVSPFRRRPHSLAAAAAAANDADPQPSSSSEERKEYYDPREMPPLPLTVARIAVPELDHVVVDASSEATRLASLAVWTEMWRRDEQYGGRLNRRSAITALCMYDRDDVASARVKPGAYPNIDLLERVYREGLDVEVVVEEK